MEVKPVVFTEGSSSSAHEQPYGIPLEEANVEKMNSLLETNSWNLNIFQMSSLSNHKPLTSLGYHIFKVCYSRLMLAREYY